MRFEDPIVVIFYAFITCFLIAQIFDFVLRKRRKKAMNEHLKKLENDMAKLRLKMQDSALDLQETIAMINKEYGSSFEEMNMYKTQLEKEIDQTIQNQEQIVADEDVLKGSSDRNLASVSKKTSKLKEKSNEKNKKSDTKLSRKKNKQ